MSKTKNCECECEKCAQKITKLKDKINRLKRAIIRTSNTILQEASTRIMHLNSVDKLLTKTLELTTSKSQHGDIKRKYSCTRYSQASIEWLKTFPNYPNIQHAENIGEFTIPTTRYRADGYDPTTNTIYEFHGTYWHGDPRYHRGTDIHPVVGKTFGELYERTIKKENIVRRLGYNLITIWEADFIKTIDTSEYTYVDVNDNLYNTQSNSIANRITTILQLFADNKRKINKPIIVGKIAALETIKVEEARAVLEAVELTDEEYEKMKTVKTASMADVSAMKKYLFRKFYKFDGNLTEELLREYSEKSMQQCFYRRDRLTYSGEDKNAVLKLIVKYKINTAKILTIENAKSLFNESRDIIALELMDMFGIDFGTTKEFTKEEIKTIIDANYDKLSADCEKICKIFSTDIVKLPKKDNKDYTKTMLSFINGKLSSQYGIVLKLNKSRTKYIIDDKLSKIIQVKQ